MTRHHSKYFTLFQLYRLVAIMSAEGGMRSFKEAVEGEPLVSDYAMMVSAASAPQFPTKHFLKLFAGSRVAHLFEASRK